MQAVAQGQKSPVGQLGDRVCLEVGQNFRRTNYAKPRLMNRLAGLPFVEMACFIGVVADFYWFPVGGLSAQVFVAALHQSAIHVRVHVFALCPENSLPSPFLNSEADIFKSDSDSVSCYVLLVQNAQTVGIQVAIDADALGVKVRR